MQNPRTISFKGQARSALLSGVNQLADAVASTLGPSGRNVLIMTALGQPHPTKDGVSVARQVHLSDPVENAGAQMVKVAANRVAEDAGDGTTTATVLARAFVVEASPYMDQPQYNPVFIKRHIDKLVAETTAVLKQRATPVDTAERIQQVATISANGDAQIAEYITRAVTQVGTDGIVTIQESSNPTDTLLVKDGVSFDSGYLTPYFINVDGRNEYSDRNVNILVTDMVIDNVQRLGQLLDHLNGRNEPILIIAEDFSPEATHVFAVNASRGVKICAVKAPAFGERRREILKDIAALVGATFISSELNVQLEDVSPQMLGMVESVKVNRHETTLIGGDANVQLVNHRIGLVRDALTNSSSDYDKGKLEERLAMLNGKAAVIEVGGNSELEMKEKKDRYDDAVHAVRAAIAEGVLPGGGWGLALASREVLSVDIDGDMNEVAARVIFERATIQPLHQIHINQGSPLTLIELSDKVGEMSFETYPYPDIIDPLRVTRLALEAGASVGTMIMTTDCVIVEEPSTIGKRGGMMG